MMHELVARFAEFFARPPLAIGVDVADITIVAAVLYRVLVVIKGTRAMQMAIGLGLVFIVYWVAHLLDLVTLFTMLDDVKTYVVLIVVVVFQADIRRALTRFGRRPWLRGMRTAETHAMEEVIKAATHLAQKRIGALIVLERDASLDEFCEQGTLLDAEVSKELLYSIFIPSFENPMHDGAVIIRERRIWQAAALLPLTNSPKLDKTLGTRHRAAIGITEETDAVVVVVSEEKGQISLCFGGNMVRNLDANSLREAMLGLFYRRPVASTATRDPLARTSVAPRASVAPPADSTGRSAVDGTPPSKEVEESS